MAPKKSNMSEAVINKLVAQRVADALAEYEANRNIVNGNGNGNDNGSHDSGGGGERMPHTARVCTYKEFLNCRPFNFEVTEGAVGLAHWTVRYDAAYGMPWKTLMRMMTENYYPSSKIKKLETKLWNFVVKGTDVKSYTQCFRELILLCSRMVPEESNRVEKYTGGLHDIIQGSVMASNPIKIQESIELVRILMDQKLLTYDARQAENKRRLDNNSRNNHAQQPPYKRQNVARAYTTGSGEKRDDTGTLPLCNKWYYKNDYLKLMNKNHGNYTGNGEARGRAYALGGGEPNPDSNTVMGTFLLNNCCASILFDTGVDRIFVSTTFSSLVDITPSTLDNSYDVELANGRITGVNTILRGLLGF
ncbi:reverse transcriptase domain-containing protein [Tanacetum coccineum]